MGPAEQSTQTARGTILVAGSLVLLKAVAWLLTSSSGVLGSALDSGMDLLASLTVLWAVMASRRPADADHPWGHGKAEGLASLFQAGIIFASGLGLLVEAWSRFQSDRRIELPWIGIVVMILSILITAWWLQRLRNAARSTGSVALEADSHHYAGDLLMNAGVILGLLLAMLFDGHRLPDLIVSVLIAGMILHSAYTVLMTAIDNLMDSGLKPHEAAAVLRAVSEFAPRVAGFHDLRSRRSGPDVFLEIHLDIDRHLSFVEAHDLSEAVQRAIESAIPRSRVTVHPDPL